METFKVKYYKTEEHVKGEVGDFVEDTYYSFEGGVNKAEDLMYVKLYYKVEVYNSKNLQSPVYILNQSKFNRRKYKETKNK
jgi:hypothetical protein